MYQILIGFFTLLSLALSIHTYKMHKNKSELIFSFLMLFIAIFTAGFFFELTAVALILTGVILFWSIFKYKIFSIMPITRDKIMESIHEGIIVINDFGRIIDKNEAIDGFIMNSTEMKYDIIGKRADDILSHWPQWVSACKNIQKYEFEIET
jgi:hypothetical protein